MNNIYALGTSIIVGASTDNNPPFISTLCKETGFNEVNLGVAGATVGKEHHQNADIWNPQETLGAIEGRARTLKFVNFKKGDIVMLECINDFRVSISTASFKQALINSIEHIKSNSSFVYPDNKIYLFVPHQFRSTGVNRPGCNDRNLYYSPFVDYINIIKSMEIKYNFVKVINMYGLFEPTDKYVYDGVHLSELGKRKYIDEIKPIIGRGDNNMNIDVTKRKVVVAYVPLDDRPCNTDRIMLAGQAMGMNIIMPPKDLYKTCLDSQPLNSNKTQIGNPDGILDWLSSLDLRNVDTFLISLDQIYSGGLVGSRSLKHSKDASKEVARFERLMRIVNGKPVYFQDSVLRLTTTVGFEGCGMDVYDKIYSYASVERCPARINPETSYSEVIDKITDSYGLDANYKHIDYTRFGLTDSMCAGYINARTRKMNILKGTMNKILSSSNIAYYAFGIDDSNNKKTIQENEINFIKDVIVYGNESKCKIYGGIDETAMCLLSRIATDFYCNRKLKVNVKYYGGGENNVAEEWNYLTLKQVINGHLDMCGAVAVADGSPNDLELLVLTKPVNGKDIYQNSNDLHWQVNQNNQAKVLTSIIDASEYKYKLASEGGAHFQKRLVGDFGSPIELSKLLSYSSWNTVANASGIAIGHAIGRCAFLKLGWNTRIREALEGQVKSLFMEFAKDLCYQIGAKWGVESYLMKYVDQEDSVKLTDAQRKDVPNNFYKYGVNQYLGYNDWKNNCLWWASYYYMTDGSLNIHKLAKIFYTNAFAYETHLSPTDCSLTQINWINYPYENGDSSWFKLEYPWSRTFECTFPVNVSFK